MDSKIFEQQFEEFSREVADHKITVLRDDGLYRHLRCSTGSYAYQFDIITWPGYLCFCGDLGTFVFSRLQDMFKFFRGRRTAVIDRRYLAEKAVAGDKTDGIEEFSEERFKAAVRADFESFTEGWEDAQKASLWEEIEAEVLPAAEDGISGAIRSAMEFAHKGREVFPEFWDHRLKDYTLRFWWCCYAVPWAIEQYDAITASPASAQASEVA